MQKTAHPTDPGIFYITILPFPIQVHFAMDHINHISGFQKKWGEWQVRHCLHTVCPSIIHQLSDQGRVSPTENICRHIHSSSRSVQSYITLAHHGADFPSIFPGNLTTNEQTQLQVRCPSGSISLCGEGEKCGVWTVDWGVSLGRAGMGQAGNLSRMGTSRPLDPTSLQTSSFHLAPGTNILCFSSFFDGYFGSSFDGPVGFDVPLITFPLPSPQ